MSFQKAVIVFLLCVFCFSACNKKDVELVFDLTQEMQSSSQVIENVVFNFAPYVIGKQDGEVALFSVPGNVNITINQNVLPSQEISSKYIQEVFGQVYVLWWRMSENQYVLKEKANEMVIEFVPTGVDQSYTAEFVIKQIYKPTEQNDQTNKEQQEKEAVADKKIDVHKKNVKGKTTIRVLFDAPFVSGL